MKHLPLAGLRRRSLTNSIAGALAIACATAGAQANELVEGENLNDLEEVIVTATPYNRDVGELTQSAAVLRGSELERELANSIGETLTRLPGLSNASFGQNVGRPVIRGQQGLRIGVLNDGMNSFDVSALSQDHAVPTEPFLADQVEVLRGPTTLLYGSGAIGGVVNMVTTTIPEVIPEDGFTGRAMLQGDTAANERFGAARLDFGTGSFAFHASGFYRRTDDYEIPGAAELYPDDDHDDHESEDHDDHEHEDEEVTGVLENSFLDNQGGSLGVSWIGERWRAGVSWTAYDSDYGIPGAHSHSHGEEEHEGEDHDDDHDSDHDHEEVEENVTIDLESRRISAVLNGTDPFPGFSEFDFKLVDTDYTHTEFEGEEVGTLFDSETLDMRVELTHNPWGDFVGTFGGQWSDIDFSAEGEEAFVPPSKTKSWGLFWVESVAAGDWQFDLGVRYEDTNIDSFLIEHEHEHEDEEHGEHEDEMPEAASRDFNPFSASVGALWHFNDWSHVSFNLARAQRAPSAVELFSNGPHAATQTFEIGNPDLRKETNTHFSGTFRLENRAVTGSLTLYRDDYDDFIYLADTGEMEDGLPVQVWSQQDAKFTGGELEIRWDIGTYNTGRWQVFGFYDRVKATLDDGEPVPLIPPRRFGLGADWNLENWAASILWIRADDHTRTAQFETPTPGYDLLNADLYWNIPLNNRSVLQLYLQGRNLLDEDIRNSTSYLKDQAPQIGRNFVFGVRAMF